MDQGQIAGTVKDSSESVIPGARVTVRSLATGAVRSTDTGVNGNYVFTNLQIGFYEVAVEATGFKKYVQTNVKVDTATRTTTDVVLEIGAVSETVNVSATAAQVQRETAQIGRVIEARQISDLALNGRNPVNLALMKAGVVGGNFNAFTPDSSGMNLSINGGQTTGNNITIDGVNAVRTRSGTAVLGVLNVDAIQEVQILTASYPAEYGRVSDGQIRFVSRGGSRDSTAPSIISSATPRWMPAAGPAIRVPTVPNPAGPHRFGSISLAKRERPCDDPRKVQHRPFEAVLLCRTGVGGLQARDDEHGHCAERRHATRRLQ